MDAASQRNVCPVCEHRGPFALYVEAHVDAAKLDHLSFSSRKRPELMHHRLVLCPDCQLLFANPLPTSAALRDAYQAAGFESAAEATYASRTYAGLLDRIRALLPDAQGALDIGTGEASFLAELEARGFQGLVGIEPSRAAIDAAPPRLRPLIREGTLDDVPLAPRSFALVTCFQTLEHVTEPLALARRAHDALKPGGVFFAVCHNRRAWSARLLGRRSPIFDIEHVQLFCPQSAEALLRRAGFVDARAHWIMNRYPLAYWCKLLPLPARLKSRLLRALGGTALGAWPIGLPAGNLALYGRVPRDASLAAPHGERRERLG